jgi:formylmethanofuran dehydrogenase subunit C
MSGLTLKLRQAPDMRIDLGGLTPSKLAGHSVADVERLGVETEFGTTAKVGDFFTVTGAPSETLVIEGGSARLDFVGKSLDLGTLIVEGDAGAYAGSDMTRGRLDIRGNCGAYLAAGAKGGIATVKGSAGEFLGGVRAGEKFGMLGGIVVVEGDIGIRAGERMRRGTVITRGAFGAAAGSRMVGGTLWTEKGFGAAPGQLLRRGTLIGPKVDGLLPTFSDCGRHELLILQIISRHITEALGALAPKPLPATVRRFAGDMTTIGKGEILLTA